jgi:hypothetical protein
MFLASSFRFANPNLLLICHASFETIADREVATFRIAQVVTQGDWHEVRSKVGVRRDRSLGGIDVGAAVDAGAADAAR